MLSLGATAISLRQITAGGMRLSARPLPLGLLVQMREQIRLKHYSIRAEQVHCE